MASTFLSPDGHYLVRLVLEEMRMSHWVSLPVLLDAANDSILLDLSQTLWSADSVEWSPNSDSVTLSLRRYPGDQPAVKLVVYPSNGLCEISTEYFVFMLSIPEAAAWFAQNHILKQ